VSITSISSNLIQTTYSTGIPCFGDSGGGLTRDGYLIGVATNSNCTTQATYQIELDVINRTIYPKRVFVPVV